MGLRTNSVALRLQKKVVGKLSRRGLARKLFPEGNLDALDVFYDVLVCYFPAAESEQVINSVLKTVAKLGVMLQEQRTVDAHLEQLLEMQERLKALFRTVQSFHRLEHSFAAGVLTSRLDAAEAALLAVVRLLLSHKSEERVRSVFRHVRHPQLLEDFFRPGGRHEQRREQFVDALDLLVP